MEAIAQVMSSDKDVAVCLYPNQQKLQEMIFFLKIVTVLVQTVQALINLLLNGCASDWDLSSSPGFKIVKSISGITEFNCVKKH